MPQSPGKTTPAPTAATTDKTARKQLRIQAAQDAKDGKACAKKKESGSATAAPGPGRAEPAPPLPAQHLEKPGSEADMALQPRYEAPHYQGSGKLEGLSALITGGDSGIGRTVAVLFAREGADVAIAYLDEHDDARRTCALIEAEGGRSLAIAGDVKDAAFCVSAVRSVVKTFGKLNVRVNNAAFQAHAAALEDLAEERFDETFRTNIYGYFPHVQGRAGSPAVRRLHHQHGVGNGVAGSKELLDYSATRGGHPCVHQVAGAQPGRPGHLRERPGARPRADAPEPRRPLGAGFGKTTHLGRPAQPEEISPAYVFLAAPCCSSYITGTVLPVMESVGDGA